MKVQYVIGLIDAKTFQSAGSMWKLTTFSLQIQEKGVLSDLSSDWVVVNVNWLVWWWWWLA